MSNEPNELFVTDGVRDYIKALHDAKASGQTVETKAMTTSLYLSLIEFMKKVSKYDTVDKRNTLKNYLVTLLCSDKEFYNEEFKKEKLDSFIKELEKKQSGLFSWIGLGSTEEGHAAMIAALRELQTKVTTDSLLKNNCLKIKEEIMKTLGTYFKTSTSDADIAKHEEIRKILMKYASDDKHNKDVILFLEFFNFKACKDEECDNVEGTDDYKTEKKLLNLKKGNNDDILLLELFKGKDVKIIETDKGDSSIWTFGNACILIALLLIAGGALNHFKKFPFNGGSVLKGGKVTVRDVIKNILVVLTLAGMIQKQFQTIASTRDMIMTGSIGMLAVFELIELYEKFIDVNSIQINIPNNVDKSDLDELLKNKAICSFINSEDLATLKNKTSDSTLVQDVNNSIQQNTSFITQQYQEWKKTENTLEYIRKKGKNLVNMFYGLKSGTESALSEDASNPTTEDKTIDLTSYTVLETNDNGKTLTYTHKDSSVSEFKNEQGKYINNDQKFVDIISLNGKYYIPNMLLPSTASVGGNYRMMGGEDVNCYTISNLKHELLAILIKFNDRDDYGKLPALGKCDSSLYNISDAQPFDIVISDGVSSSSTKTESIGCQSAPDTMTKLERLNCLADTNLARRHKIAFDKSKGWDTLKKSVDSSFIPQSPNGLELLKQFSNTSDMNLMFGGAYQGDELRSANSNVSTSYSFRNLVEIMSKALNRANMSGIKLDASTVAEIQKNIDSLKSADQKLLDYGFKIMEATKINSINQDKTLEPMNDAKLNEYIQKHKELLKGADKTASKLSMCLVKFMEAFQNMNQ